MKKNKARKGRRKQAPEAVPPPPEKDDQGYVPPSSPAEFAAARRRMWISTFMAGGVALVAWSWILVANSDVILWIGG